MKKKEKSEGHSLVETAWNALYIYKYIYSEIS